jgi:hypothetical protein
MKKLKIKLEYNFVVPDDTKIVNDENHGLFITNEHYGLKSMPFMTGLILDYVKVDENGEFEESTLSNDEGVMEGFLYSNAETHVKSEKTTITLGKEKYQFGV